MRRRDFVKTAGLSTTAMLAGCGSTPAPDPSPAPATAPAAFAGPFAAVIRFSGLAGVAISQDRKRAQVLFVDWNKAGIMKHVPVLKIRLENSSVQNPPERDPMDPNVGVWPIHGAHVIIDAGSGDLSAGSPSMSDCPTNDDDWKDLRRIADLRDVLPAGKAVVNPEYVKEQDLTGTFVATRIPLPRGVLSGAPPTVPKMRKRTLALGGVGSAKRYPMTDLLQLDLPATSSLKITIRKFTGGDTAIEIKPVSPHPVFVWLQNHFDPDIDPAAIKRSHFPALYDLLKDPPPEPSKRHFPGNAEDCHTKKALSDFPVYCPEGQFELP